MDNKLSTFLKQGPAFSPSKRTHAVLMRVFIAGMMLAVVALAVWAYGAS